MASSSSSTHVCEIKHDVFISFRGSDTRHGFLSHLTKELRRKQIDVYVDQRLERGDEISASLLKAIEVSDISLVIFSNHYASSKWCLEELVKIMECKEVNGQIVIPVFYNIDPSHVRHQEGTYGDAFTKHKQMFKDNMEKLQIWRSALAKVANLSGYHYSSNTKDECQLIDEIVKDVCDKLDNIYPIQPKRLVGSYGNFARVEQLLEIESQEVLVLGIWGMGGIGKTTLAHAICEKLSSHFESCCFLANVREESKRINGLSYLSQKLLFGLLDQENLYMNGAVLNAAEGSIRRRLHRKRVLIVLDDVDASEQLEYLVKEQPCLGPGSRVIVTSRDKHVLISRGVRAIYEVKELDFQESLRLFSLNAFNQRHPTMGFEELSAKVVNYAKGNPLALKVLGSHLHSRNMETWESVLRKLQKYPNVQIQDVLKVSYDGLDDTEKDIFLDIAFFFKGKPKDDVIRVLDACGLYAQSGIASLVDKALLVAYEERIEMHDLLQEMGEQIVREECIKNPGTRSRLKDIEEIYDVLKNNMGTDAVEGIILDVSRIEDVQLSANAFKKMTNLRILKFYEGWRSSNLNLPFGLESISAKLRYFRWDRYPLNSLPLDFCAEKLVELHMEHSKVRKLWDGVQNLVNLKKINLIGCRQLRKLPDFSRARNLEDVCLSSCESLCSIHPSILSMHSLVSLDLCGCKKIKRLQSESHLKSLINLDVDKCFGLKEFSMSSEALELSLSDSPIEILDSSIRHWSKLRILRLNGSRLRSLPIKDLSCLTSLEELELKYFKQVIGKMELHSLFDALCSLEYLDFTGCDKLVELPDNISALRCLTELSLGESGVKSLPPCIEHLPKLTRISLRKCRRLRSILGLPPSIRILDAADCTSLVSVCTPTITSEGLCRFSFENCIKFDEHSICNIEEFAYRSIVSRMHEDTKGFFICYPESRAPGWMRSNMTTKPSITIDLASPFDQLLGFISCCVLRQFSSKEKLSICCHYSVHSGKEDKLLGYSVSHPPSQLNLKSAHVCLEKVLSSSPLGNALRSYKEGINPKLKYLYSVSRCSKLVKGGEINGLIEACGMCPIYASDYDNLL